jgi:hypothetical protein
MDAPRFWCASRRAADSTTSETLTGAGSTARARLKSSSPFVICLQRNASPRMSCRYSRRSSTSAPFAVDALADARLQSLGAGRDGRERVVDLVDDARGEPAHGRQPLGARHRAVGLHARRDVLADGDDVRDLLAVDAHRHLAHEPVARRAVAAARLLLDALNLAGAEGALELALHRAARLALEDLEDVAPQHVAARDALPAQLAVAVPRDDAVVAVYGVERDGQAVDDGLGEAALALGLGRAPLDLAREVDGGRARGLVERGDARGERGLLRGGLDQSLLGLAAGGAAVVADDERAQSPPLEAERSGELDDVHLVLEEEARAVVEHFEVEGAEASHARRRATLTSEASSSALPSRSKTQTVNPSPCREPARASRRRRGRARPPRARRRRPRRSRPPRGGRPRRARARGAARARGRR